MYQAKTLLAIALIASLIMCIRTPSDLLDRKMVLFGTDHLSLEHFSDKGIYLDQEKITSDLYGIQDVSFWEDSLAILASEGPAGSGVYAVSYLDLSQNIQSRPIQLGKIARFSVSPDSSLLVSSIPIVSSDNMQLKVNDIASGEAVANPAILASYPGNASWHRDGRSFVYKSRDGLIVSFDLTSGTQQEFTVGEAPAWSQTEDRIAYYLGKKLFFFDPNSHNISKHYESAPWSGGFVGKIHWTSDDRYLTVASYSGLLGYQLTCNVIDSQTGRRVYKMKGHLWCGPWLP